MSLKAKLESVIYAAEEPVTLARLAVLFAAEALEYKAAQAADQAETAEAASEPLPFIAEGEESLAPAAESTEEPGAPSFSASFAEEGGTAETSPGQSSLGQSSLDQSSLDQSSLDQSSEATPEPAPDPAAEAKLAARARDREVKTVLKGILADLIASYEADDRGIEIREIAGGYRMATKPACHDAVQLFVKSLKPPLKLSLPALETLAVIAYKQPVTAPEVSEIRGVESVGVLGSLMARKLIATAGRKQVIGRPILYKTTREFLLRFGLKDLAELPSMEEFEKMAVEIEEMEPAATAASEESASNPEKTYQDEPSPQAETEAVPDGSEESSSEESAVEEVHSGEENGSEEGSADGGKESSGQEVERETEEIR
jgi:segregation and condensation protein B